LNKVFACITLLIIVSLSACGKSTTPPPANQGAGGTTAGGATTTVDAQAIYKQNCISCHGNNLEGGVGPSLQKVGGKYGKDQIATILSNGRGAMPSYKGKLSDNEIGALATWLSEKK
jgi:cytochrome c551